MRPLPLEIERYLKELKLALTPLGAADRDEILAEVRSHLDERLAQGRAEVLADFPPAERYAAAFVAERSLVSALVEGTPWALARSLWVGRIERLLALAAAIPLGLVQLLALCLVALGVVKPLFFAHVGLWVADNGRVALGYVSDPSARELLGWWAVPLFIAGGALLFLVAHRLQTALARRRLRRVRQVGMARD